MVLIYGVRGVHLFMLQDSLHVCMHMTALVCSQFQNDCQPIGKVIVCESLSPQLARLLQKVLGKQRTP